MAEGNHVAVGDQVLLALETQLAVVAARGERAAREQAIAGDDFGADEPFLDVAVDFACGGGGGRPFADRPGAGLQLSRCDVGDESEKGERFFDEAVQSRFFQAEALQKFFSVFFIEARDFFFDAGKGATIAFFYYIGTDRPEKYLPEDHHFYAATHTAWSVPTAEELSRWKQTLESRGLIVSPHTRHEILESIYFRDPNGYPIEITLRLRDVEVVDETDARLTIEAAMQLEDELRATGSRLKDIDTVWRRIDRPSNDAYMVPLASGLIAGEAIVAVVVPLLVALGILSQ